jgi:hypothetical protein
MPLTVLLQFLDADTDSMTFICNGATPGDVAPGTLPSILGGGQGSINNNAPPGGRHHHHHHHHHRRLSQLDPNIGEITSGWLVRHSVFCLPRNQPGSAIWLAAAY